MLILPIFEYKINAMTTITIKGGPQLKKTSFLSIDELLNYLLKNEDYGILHPIDEKEITPAQKNRFHKALNTDKSKMLNI